MLSCPKVGEKYQVSRSASGLSPESFVELPLDVQRDEATGLLHIQSFTATCHKIIRERDEAIKHKLLLFVDADNLKLVNDALGHSVGDAYIRHVAEAMRISLPRNAISCRKGGDEFLAMIPCARGDESHQIVKKVGAALNQKLTLAGHNILVSCSIGYSLRSMCDSDLNGQLEEADLALYWAKENAKGSVKEYCPVDCFGIKQNRQLSFEIQSVLEQETIALEFQPIYFAEKRKIVGAEALLRWNHEELGSVPADKIVKAACESGQGQALSEYVMRQAFSAASRWDSEVYLSVNVQAADLLRTDFVQRVLAISLSCKFPLNRLNLEVTETEDLKRVNTVLDNIKNLRELGVKVGIDDFGTGYASMHSLDSYSFDFIKVDRSLVAHCDKKHSSRVFLKAIVQVATSLGISVVAEGAETLEEIAFLRSAGFRFVQGFYFSRPIPLERFACLISDNSQIPSISQNQIAESLN